MLPHDTSNIGALPGYSACPKCGARCERPCVRLDLRLEPLPAVAASPSVSSDGLRLML